SRSERLDPEDVRATLSPYYARLRAELERYGGTVEKFIGDAVMAVFGAPVAHEDDAERAVRAALAIRDAMAEDQRGLEVRIGVNTGEALVTLGARPEEGEGIVAGDVVNTAARIQAAAAPNTILVGEQTNRSKRSTRSTRSTRSNTARSGRCRARGRRSRSRSGRSCRPRRASAWTSCSERAHRSSVAIASVRCWCRRSSASARSARRSWSPSSPRPASARARSSASCWRR